MLIHIVRPGDSAYAIALRYQIPMSLLIQLNGLEDPSRLAVGQALVIRKPRRTYTVAPGDTLSSIALKQGLSVRELYRRNPVLGGRNTIWPGQTLVLAYDDAPGAPIFVNGYAYPHIPLPLLTGTLPFLTYLTPFTYGITAEGGLIPPRESPMLALAAEHRVGALLHLSTLSQEGRFSSELGHAVLRTPAMGERLIDALLSAVETYGFRGIDVDFEYLPAEDAVAYAAFLTALGERLRAQGKILVTALAPKTSRDQPGLLYEGHDYRAVGAASDYVLLMTYEWGYTAGPPMAVAPLPNVRRVVEFALTEIPAEKIWLGVPNYGYDWPLPFRQGTTRARSLSSDEAVALAVRYNQAIQYDTQAQSPWFRYTGDDGVEHEVWFEDARSIQAKLSLIAQYGLAGAGYWNLMRSFPQNWQVLDALYTPREDAGPLSP